MGNVRPRTHERTDRYGDAHARTSVERHTRDVAAAYRGARLIHESERMAQALTESR